MKFKTIGDLKSYFENTPEEELKFFITDVFSWRSNGSEVAFTPCEYGNKKNSLDWIDRSLKCIFEPNEGECYRYNESTKVHFENNYACTSDLSLYFTLKEIKAIVIYECLDGTRWNTKEEAKKYAELYDRIEEISLYLSSNTSKYIGSQKYIPQDKEKVLLYKTEILKLAAEYIPNWGKYFNECITGERHISHASRIIDDCEYPKLQSAFFRLSCISETTYIEYDQPYYADHEDVFIENYISKN